MSRLDTIKPLPPGTVVYRVQITLCGTSLVSESIYAVAEVARVARALAKVSDDAEAHVWDAKGRGVAWVYPDRPPSIFDAVDTALVDALRAAREGA